jgi:SAM-dependent methyltransferase
LAANRDQGDEEEQAHAAIVRFGRLLRAAGVDLSEYACRVSRTPPAAIDFGTRSDDYAEHRPGFPASFYDRLEGFAALDGARALDLGTGPGVIAIELAARGAAVTGIDIAENQIRAAELRAAERGLADRCAFRVAPAEATGLEHASVDLVTAGQCWIWFDQDRALAEVLRILRPGGLVVIAHYCYLPAHSAVAAATEALILEHNPGWGMGGHDGLYPEHIDAVIGGGFDFVEQFCYDHDQSFTHAGWRGRIRTCNGVGSGAMTPREVAAFDAALAQLLRDRFPCEPLAIKHRVWAVVARRP